MGKFTVIPQNTFTGLQLDAGVLLNKFDPANPVEPADEDIITATTGGITINATPTFSDLGEDVDNVPANMKEFKHLDSWDMSIATTGLGTTAEGIKLALGCADIDAETSAIVPRADLKQTDFSDIWWVGDRADGGCVAVQLKNALATAGFSLTTTKSGKGQVGLTITGHVSIAAQKTMPMVIYSKDPDSEATEYAVTQNLTNVTSSFTDEKVNANDPLTVTLTADTHYDLDSVTVSMGGVDITSTVYNSETGEIAITNVTATVLITASAAKITHAVTQNLTNVTSTFSGSTVDDGAAFTATLEAESTYTMGTVTVEMGGTDITSTAYDSGTGEVSIADVTGAIEITATAS